MPVHARSELCNAYREPFAGLTPGKRALRSRAARARLQSRNMDDLDDLLDCEQDLLDESFADPGELRRSQLTGAVHVPCT